MKIVNIILKVLLCLILLMPVLGPTGMLGEATRDLYNTDQGFAFIDMLMQIGYINYIMALVSAVAIVLIIMKRTALAALLILPMVVNIVAFHAFLDGGLFTGGAILAVVFAALNIYFLWQNRGYYRSLWEAKS